MSSLQPVQHQISPTGQPGPVLLIRADAGGELGTGHVMRMLALAQAWLDEGGVVRLASIQCPDALSERLEREDVTHRHLVPCDQGGPEDITQTLALARACAADWIVLDGYGHGLPMQEALHEAGFNVMAVDDYGHTEVWCADLILNQNFDATERRYDNRLVGASLLAGPRHALLRREFRSADTTNREPLGDRLRVLVTLGGVDAGNYTGQILASLESASVPAMDLRVLVGPANPHAATLAQLARTSRHRVELVHDCSDMPAMYRWADRIISAAGSTCYEWLLFGLPAAVIAVAANQQPIATWLAHHRAATVLSPHEPAGWVVALARWLPAGERPPAGVLDAQGTSRVVAALRARLAPHTIEEVCHV